MNTAFTMCILMMSSACLTDFVFRDTDGDATWKRVTFFAVAMCILMAVTSPWKAE